MARVQAKLKAGAVVGAACSIAHMTLTPRRVKTYCALLILGNLSLLGFEIRRSHRYALETDFAAFYNAGQVFNAYPHSRLYDENLQTQTFGTLTDDYTHSSPFVYPAWFVLPFAALARLPSALAFVIWVIVSLGMVSAGYMLAWHVLAFPTEWRLPGLFAALAFPPFQIFNIRGGQVAAVGVFFLSLAFYLHRRHRPVLAGVALALMLYKPTLLLLLLPMVLVARQWRLLMGFALGAVTLSLLTFLLVGLEGLAGYFQILHSFYAAGNTAGIFPTWYYIDIGAAIRLLAGKPIGIFRIVLLAAVLPLLWGYWRRGGMWALTITATLLFSVYAPIYDTTLLILVAMLAKPERIGSGLLAIVYLTSAITVPIAYFTHVQVMTIALVWLMWRLWKAQPELCDARCDTNLERSVGPAADARIG